MTAPDPVKFLLVDDLVDNLLALEALLRRDDLVLLQARTGAEALELLLKHDVALALVDVQMPEMDGFELAELMRGAEKTRRVPIIFLTAGSADAVRRFRGYEAGAVDFLQKPVAADMLRSKADVFFELYRQRQEVAQQRDELRIATGENLRLLQESRQQAAALQEADRRKDEFLAMLAHELRNPLAPVLNAVELLKLVGTHEPVVGEATEIISRQVAHMARLVDDLLDVARIARGKIQLQLAACDLARIVRQTAEDYRPLLTAHGVTLDLHVPDQPLMLTGDATRLAQVVGNLLHNASKFTPSGGRVTVTAGLDGAGTAADIVVKDTGAGLEAAVLARIFEPFNQAEQSIDRKRGGLGLGLALVKELIKLHGGSVRAASDGPGQGATFHVHLPLSRQAAAAPAPAAPPPEVRGLRILVIEDNQDAALSLRMLLNFRGHTATVAFDAASGLEAARAAPPDVVISDLGLPGPTDGFGVARAIRSDPALASIYLIALSGYAREEDRARAHESGFDHHLVKPIKPAELDEVLQELHGSG